MFACLCTTLAAGTEAYRGSILHFLKDPAKVRKLQSSSDAVFESAAEINMRLIAGKVMMDRNAPDYLLDTAESGYEETEKLIKKWHGKGRALYAITPRFAATSTPEQLTLAGKLRKKYPAVYVHTHSSENRHEIEWVKSPFPARSGYLDVYDHLWLN